MSMKQVFGACIGLITILTLAGGGVLYFKHEGRSSVRAFPHVKPWAHSLKGKMGRAFDVSVMGSPTDESHVFHIQGQINIIHTVQGNVEYQWILPEGMTLRSGELSGRFDSMFPGDSMNTDLEVEVMNENLIGKPLVLQVSSDMGEYALGGSGTLTVDRMIASEESDSFMQSSKPTFTRDSSSVDANIQQ